LTSAPVATELESASQAAITLAMLNILEDSAEEQDSLRNAQRAVINILEDFDEERARLDDTQRATLNILDDFGLEKIKADRAFRDLEREGAERQRVEIALEAAKATTDAANEALEQANEQLESFSYSVAHDLRAPLRAIDGFSKILIQDHAASLDAEGRRVLGVVITSVAKMGALIDDLLTFSRLGRAELAPLPIDMVELVGRIAREMQAEEPSRVVDLTVEPMERGAGDPALIRQVWTNLLSNSMKFTRYRDSAQIVVSCQRRDDEVVYSVTDNGAGFDMTYAAKLFGVFQRLHSPTEFEGTGIGLAIIERIVKRHGGQVWAEGVVDQGATFSFSLPRGEGAT
jgi:light-regulated signal transduction histidine kinase (bacteriophytochrome)